MALIDNTDITEEEIAQQGLTALNDKYQKSVGFFAWDYFVALGKVIRLLWDKVVYIASCLTDLSNMDYDDLVNFVFQTRGIVAKTETYANGLLKVSNGTGTINAGDLFKTSFGVEFVATETKNVTTNDTFSVQCTQAGTIGNVQANTITVIPTTITGIVSVTNEQAFTNGYEKESKDALLKRYYDDIQNPVISGNVYHYKKWALEVSGVGGVKVKPLWDGDNTVKVVIIDSNNGVPDSDLINAVQDYIDPYELVNGTKVGWGCGNGQAPIGAYCTVTGATAKNLTILITGLVIRSGAVKADVLTNIENSIKNYLDSITFSDTNYISYSKIGALIMTSDGVSDYTSFTINGDTDSITLIDNNTTSEIPVLSSVGENE